MTSTLVHRGYKCSIFIRHEGTLWRVTTDVSTSGELAPGAIGEMLSIEDAIYPDLGVRAVRQQCRERVRKLIDEHIERVAGAQSYRAGSAD
jgi:hypothetical protein